MAEPILTGEELMKISESDKKRFWSKVKKSNHCWTYSGARNPEGFGSFSLQGGKQIRAHRFSWIISYGEIPAGKFICHHCDNPPCVNPGHLFAGTPAENVKDSLDKGRRHWAIGEKHPKAKLTDKMVYKIRSERRRKNTPMRALAKSYGVSCTVINNIINRKIWRHLPEEANV